VIIAWLPGAEASLNAQIDYITADSPDAARRQSNLVLAAVAGLADFPNIGRPGRVEGTRELVVARTPFIVAYKVRETDVAVIRVVHGAQLWPPRF
jgi:plasmid stabilization system protein ParE